MMRIDETSLQTVKNLTATSSNILLIAHRNPDGDTIGSVLGLKFALQIQLGKKVTVACADPIPDNFEYLPTVSDFVSDFKTDDFDLIISVDVGAHYLLKYHETKPEILSKKIPFINIDHHPSNDNFGTVNIVMPACASTSMIIYYLLKGLNLSISPHIATCLLTGIYYDTGSLMHSNTSKDTYLITAELLRKGANFRMVIKNLFHTTSVNQMRLWGRVLGRARFNEEQAVISVVTEKDFKDCDAVPEDLTGVIDLLNSVPDSKFSMLLSEDLKGNVKGSFRTQSDQINLSEIASVFGGGGHKKAAGFTLPGKIKEKVVWDIE